MNPTDGHSHFNLCAILCFCSPFAKRCRMAALDMRMALLLTWPNFAGLSLSCMLELPAVALAVIAASLLPRSISEWHFLRFAVSGALFAVAVQIKLTALIVSPAVVISVAIVFWDQLPSHEKVLYTVRSRLLQFGLQPILGLSEAPSCFVCSSGALLHATGGNCGRATRPPHMPKAQLTMPLNL